MEKATSLEFLQAVYTNEGLPLFTRMRAAVACLPFEYPKLAFTAFIPEGGDFAQQLEHVPPQLNQGDSRGAEDGRGYRH
jgi:hypothetical protein